MVDVKRFERLYVLGVSDVIKVGPDTFALRFKRFDIETGVELEQPELQEFKTAHFQERIDSITQELSALKSILQKCSEL